MEKDKFTGDFDFSKILIKSKVMNNEGNEILRKILETGIADKKPQIITLKLPSLSRFI